MNGLIDAYAALAAAWWFLLWRIGQTQKKKKGTLVSSSWRGRGRGISVDTTGCKHWIISRITQTRQVGASVQRQCSASVGSAFGHFRFIFTSHGERNPVIIQQRSDPCRRQIHTHTHTRGLDDYVIQCARSDYETLVSLFFCCSSRHSTALRPFSFFSALSSTSSSSPSRLYSVVFLVVLLLLISIYTAAAAWMHDRTIKTHFDAIDSDSWAAAVRWEIPFWCRSLARWLFCVILCALRFSFAPLTPPPPLLLLADSVIDRCPAMKKRLWLKPEAMPNKLYRTATQITGREDERRDCCRWRRRYGGVTVPWNKNVK